MPTRPVAYLRRSSATTANGAGRVSFDVQRAAVLDLATRSGDPEPELIVEWGASGAAAESAFGGSSRGGKRHAYHVLRAEIEAGSVSALYAYSLSRLGRSTRQLLDLIEACVTAGVPVRLAKEGTIDGTSPMGRLYVTILAAVATAEAEVAAERGKDRTASMRERGAHIGRAPYGSRIAQDGTLAADPTAAPTVARVTSLYRDLGSPARVAQALNAAGVPAPRKGKWGDATVRRILARQPGFRPPTTVRGSRALPSTTFARLVRCACGATMTPERTNRRLADGTTKEYRAYICSRARFDPTHGSGRRVPESTLLAFAMAEAARLRAPEGLVGPTGRDAERVDLASQRERVMDAYQSGVIDKSMMLRRVEKIDAKVAELEAAEAAVIDVPQLDWSWPPATVNGVLRALWRYIELDVNGQPVAADWTVPEWRAEKT